LRSGYSLTTAYNLFPGLSGDGINNYNPTVVSSVWLPDADGVTRRYQFQYNNYGELARVVLPTGGAYEYDYGGGTTDTAGGAGVLGAYPSFQIYRRIRERRVYGDGSNLTSRATYSLPETQSGGGISTVGYVTCSSLTRAVICWPSQPLFPGSGSGAEFVAGAKPAGAARKRDTPTDCSG